MSDSLEGTHACKPNSSGYTSSGASHRTEKGLPPIFAGGAALSGSDNGRVVDDPKSARRAE